MRDLEYLGYLRTTTNIFSVKAKTPPTLGLQITRAPPWRFPPKIQSRLAPPLRPPIDIPPKVKLLMSIRWTPAPQCRLPSGISSLLVLADEAIDVAVDAAALVEFGGKLWGDP